MTEMPFAARLADKKRFDRWGCGLLVEADPHHLPAQVETPVMHRYRFLAPIKRKAEIHDDHVAVKDRGPVVGTYDWELPVKDYEGVALKTGFERRLALFGPRRGVATALVELRHENPYRSIVLFAGADRFRAECLWEDWQEALGVPGLVEHRDGEASVVADAMHALTGKPLRTAA